MSVQALGGYVEALMKRRNLTAAAVTDAAGVQFNYVWRLKQGEIKEPGARTVAALVRAVRGNIVTALELLLDDSATEEDGRRRAEGESLIRLDAQQLATLGRLSDDQLDLLIALASQIRPPQ